METLECAKADNPKGWHRGQWAGKTDKRGMLWDILTCQNCGRRLQVVFRGSEIVKS